MFGRAVGGEGPQKEASGEALLRAKKPQKGQRQGGKEAVVKALWIVRSDECVRAGGRAALSLARLRRKAVATLDARG